jgi:hypothetical protein
MTQSSSNHHPRSVVDAMRDQIHMTQMPARRRGLLRQSSAIASGLPVAFAVAVAVLVVAVALIAVRHGRTPSSPSAAPASVPNVQTSRQELIRLLGVLRRPQTKADLDARLLSGASVPPAFKRVAGAQWGYPKLDRSLVRVVNVPTWHAKIAIDPATYRPSPASAQRSESVDLSMWIGSAPTAPPASYTGTGLRPYNAATVRAHGLALSDPTRGKTIILVPDGVASVTLQPIRLTPPQIAPGVQQPPVVQPGEFASVTAAVHDNVAPFELKLTVTDRHARSRMTYFFVAVARATWFDSNDHVIRQTTTTGLDLPVTFQGRR